MTDTLRAYYAARAAEYDRIYAAPERQADLRAIEAWLPAQVRGRDVLEIACGTGYWTQFMAPVVRSLCGIDAAAETLAIASRRVSQPHVRFVTGDAYEIPVGLGAFTAGFAGFWLSHVPRIRRRPFLAQLHRRLEPGAVVILLDNRYVAGSSTAIAERDPDGNTYQLRRLEHGSVYRVLKNFPSAEELYAMAEGLGSEPRYKAWTYYWAFSYALPASA